MDPILQRELHDWRQRNFPSTSDPIHQALGVAEEMGELAHAVLKQSQGIRGTREDHDADMRDAIGDIVIYLAGLCSAKGWDLDKIVETTAYEVMRRDWVTDPLRGAPE